MPFCDININARQMKDSKDFTFNPPVKPVDYMVEVARSIEQDATDQVGFTPLIDYLITAERLSRRCMAKTKMIFIWSMPRRSSGVDIGATSICRPMLKIKRRSSDIARRASMDTMPTWKCGSKTV